MGGEKEREREIELVKRCRGVTVWLPNCPMYVTCNNRPIKLHVKHLTHAKNNTIIENQHM